MIVSFSKLPPCRVGIETCASAHHWARELQALGHEVKLMPPAEVKPYVKRQKNDAADAEAICEWVVYAKQPFAGPEAVLAYLSLYTHRVAISNRRLVAVDAKTVSFNSNG